MLGLMIGTWSNDDGRIDCSALRFDIRNDYMEDDFARMVAYEAANILDKDPDEVEFWEVFSMLDTKELAGGEELAATLSTRGIDYIDAPDDYCLYSCDYNEPLVG